MMKKILTLIIIAFFSSQLNAQFTTNWFNKFQYTTSAGYSNEARKVVVDASGNIFELTDVSADLDSAGHPVTTTQYFVILRKLSSAGTLLATKIINVGNMALSGHDLRASYGLEIDATTGYIYIGYTKYNSSGNYDFNIAKLNNTLSTTYWTAIYATGGNDFGVDMKLRGNIPVALVKTVNGANTTYSLVKADGSTLTPPALYSFVANTDVANDLTTAAGSNLFVAGYSIVSGAKAAMTASVSILGVLKWKSTYNHNSVTGDDYGSKVIIGTDGEIYVSGTTYTDVTNGNDALVLNYNHTTGTLVHQLSIDHTTTDIGAFIANGPVGYLYQAMWHGNTINVTKLQISNGLFISSSLFYVPVPVTPYTSLTGVTISDMQVAASGNVYVCGSITAASVNGNFSASYLIKAGGTNVAVLASNTVEGSFPDSYSGADLALDPVTNNILALRSYWGNNTTHASEKVFLTSLNAGPLREAESGNIASGIPEISFFPNPASGTINLRTDASVTSVEVYDLIGKLAANLKPVQNSLDISMLRPGIYLAKVVTTSGVTVKRITVE